MPIEFGYGPGQGDNGPRNKGPVSSPSNSSALSALIGLLTSGANPPSAYMGSGPAYPMNIFSGMQGPPMGITSTGIDSPSSSFGVPGLDPPQQVVPGHIIRREGEGPQLSPIQQALAQLEALLNQGSYMPPPPNEQDLNAALNEAASGIRDQYGAQIGAIQQQNAGAREDVRVGSSKVREMYNALARSYNKMGKRQFKQGKRLSNQLQGMGEREGQTITNQADQINQNAMQGAAALGLGNLGSEMVQDTNKTAQMLSQNAVRQGASAGRTVRGQAGNDRTFMQTTGQASRLEGTNTAADMYAQLQDYLQNNRSAIASLAGERASAIAQAKAAIQGSFADAQADYAGMAADQQQQLFDNRLAMLQLALDIQAKQRANRQNSSTKGLMDDFYDMLPEQMADPSKLLSRMGDDTVSKLYGELSSTTPMKYGYTGQKQDETDVPLVDNMANMQSFVRSRIGDEAWGSLSTAQRNALVAALLLQLQGFG